LKQTEIIKITSGRIETPVDLPDGRYIAEISTFNRRSNQQNRYYWGLVVPMIRKGIKELGTDLTHEETHEFLKSRFNKDELVNPGTGEMVEIPLSTTRLTKSEFGEYIENIQRFASEFLGLVIPDPGEQMMIEI